MSGRFRVAGARMLRGTPPYLFGLMFCRAWITVTLQLMPEGERVLGWTMGEVFDFICAAGALVLLLALACPRRLVPISSNRGLTYAWAAAMACCPLCIALGDILAVDFLYAVAAFAGGLGFTTATLAWSELYASLNPARGVLYYSLALALGELVALALTGYIKPQIYIVAAVLAILGAVCLIRSAAYTAEREPRPPLRLPSSFPWKPVALMAVYSLAFALAQSASGAGQLDYPWRFVLLIPPAIVCLAVLSDTGRFSLSVVYRGVFPVMLCALLLPAALSWLPGDLTGALVSMSFFASGIFCMLVLGELSYRLRISALALFSIVKVFNYGGMFVGSAYRDVLVGASGELSPALSLALTVAVVVAAVLMLSERKLFSNWSVRVDLDAETADDADADGAGRFGAAARLSASYGLTAREEEVLHLLVQGKTVAAMADDLFLAQGTIKAHIQHIYQKTGVHSRKELEDVLNAR